MNAFDLSSKLNPNTKDASEEDKEIFEIAAKCKSEMDDDFNTAKTIATLFDLASITNKLKDGTIKLSAEGLASLQITFKNYIEEVLGLQKEEKGKDLALSSAMRLILDIRMTARANKDWASSDKIRDDLAAVGIIIKDDKDEATWSM